MRNHNSDQEDEALRLVLPRSLDSIRSAATWTASASVAERLAFLRGVLYQCAADYGVDPGELEARYLPTLRSLAQRPAH